MLYFGEKVPQIAYKSNTVNLNHQLFFSLGSTTSTIPIIFWSCLWFKLLFSCIPCTPTFSCYEVTPSPGFQWQGPRGDQIHLLVLLKKLPSLMAAPKWQKRYAAVTIICVTAKRCLKIYAKALHIIIEFNVWFCTQDCSSLGYVQFDQKFDCYNWPLLQIDC